MKRIILTPIVAVFSLLSFLSCSHSGGSKVSTSKTTYKNERFETLPNGLKVYYVEDQSLPRISLQLLLPVGVVTEPVDRAGLNTITSNLLDQGTKTRKALEIADLFADSGADFEVAAGSDFTILSTSSLITEFTPVLNLFSEVIMNPAFPSAEIERARQQALVQLKGRQDRSGTWADLLMQKNFYQNYPYGRDILGSEESVKKINRQEIVQFYQKYYVPTGARLAVTGRLTPEIENEIKKQFGQWKAGEAAPSMTLSFQPPQKGAVVKLQSPHKAQTEIRFIQPGIARAHPEYLKLRLINEILGGSFASRLNQRVRDDLALTYSIYSSLDTKKNAGGWVISTFSKNPSAQQTVDEVFNVLKKLIAEGITQAELSAAQNLVKAQLPRALETADRLAYNLIVLDFYGVGSSYLINFNRTIDSYDLATINKALRDHLKPEQMQVLVYGQLN